VDLWELLEEPEGVELLVGGRVEVHADVGDRVGGQDLLGLRALAAEGVEGPRATTNRDDEERRDTGREPRSTALGLRWRHTRSRALSPRPLRRRARAARGGRTRRRGRVPARRAVRRWTRLARLTRRREGRLTTRRRTIGRLTTGLWTRRRPTRLAEARLTRR